MTDASPVQPSFQPAGRRALALVDGEHYPSAVADAIAAKQRDGWDIVGAVLVGGSEKLRSTPEYGVPWTTGDSSLGAVLAALDAEPVDAVLDLADEPVMVFEERLAVIAAVTGRGVSWIGADAVVEALRFAQVSVPTLAIVGTGKRIGKTAISGYIARRASTQLAGRGEVVVVAMGRGGPAEPVLVDASDGQMTVERLIEISRSGQHAASDYLEDAVLTGLTTVGCRRVGGGILGVPVHSNILDGVRLAADREPALVIVEGSGSCIPPIAPDRTILIASTARPRDLFGDLGPYRLGRADLVIIVGDDPAAAESMVQQIGDSHPELPAVAARLAPTPVGSVAGKRVAAFTTAPEAVASIVRAQLEHHGAEVVLVSCELARRESLRADVARALQGGVDAFVVEVKAAGIDVVAEEAEAHGTEVILLDNPPLPHAGFPLDACIDTVIAGVLGS